MDLVPGPFQTEHPAEKDGFNRREDNQEKSSAPEIQFIDHAILKEKNRRLTEDKSDEAKNANRFLFVYVEFIFQESNGRLGEGDGGSDSG